MFVDRVRIWARAGDGGDGACSFHREKFVPKGGPDGGDGGKGGDIVIKVNPHMNNLLHLRFKPHHSAGHGKGGRDTLKTGSGGKDCVIEVPQGTCIFKLETTEENFERSADFDSKELVIDLMNKDQSFVLCAGGRGGKGNHHFKSSVNQAPKKFQEGKPGEKGQFLLELKSIADVGLVGFPNAGKSSLLRVVSAARPKVAPYPFTTLEPMIGVIDLGEHRRMTMADIPGLVEGAHQGIGLGHDFLRHIERCRVLAFVLDMAGSEGRDPLEDYSLLRKEIKLYQEDLSKRPFFVIANKMDLPEAEENLKNFKRRFKVPVISMSTETQEGKESLIQHLQNQSLYSS
jgi:GTP-binding protein